MPLPAPTVLTDTAEPSDSYDACECGLDNAMGAVWNDAAEPDTSDVRVRSESATGEGLRGTLATARDISSLAGGGRK